MSRTSTLCLVLAASALAAAGVPAHAQFTTVDFSGDHNRRLQDNVWGSIGMAGALIDPSGVTTLGGVPFAIPVPGDNFWHAYIPGPGAHPSSPNDANDTRVLSVPVSIPGVERVYTLINTYWGAEGPGSFATVEFFATGGVHQAFELIGNVDMRDFNQSEWTNQSDNTVEVAAWSGWLGLPSQRIDRQTFPLSPDFLGETLVEIRVTDRGGFDRFDEATGRTVRQRVFVAGITAESSPGCGPADLAAPFGLLDLADVVAFTSGFVAQDPVADLDGNGLFDLADVNLFVTSFLAGCP